MYVTAGHCWRISVAVASTSGAPKLGVIVHFLILPNRARQGSGKVLHIGPGKIDLGWLVIK